MTDRELDVLVAQRIFGHKVVDVPFVPAKVSPTDMLTDAAAKEFYRAYPRTSVHNSVPHYSTDIAAAWQVVESIRSQHPDVCLNWNPKNSKWHCSIQHTPDTGDDDYDFTECYYRAYADTAPRAICLAALLSVGVEATGAIEA